MQDTKPCEGDSGHPAARRGLAEHARVSSIDIAEAVIQEAQKAVAIDDCDVKSAPSVALCSTTEML